MTLEEKLHKELDWLEIKHIDADGIIRNILSICQQEIDEAYQKGKEAAEEYYKHRLSKEIDEACKKQRQETLNLCKTSLPNARILNAHSEYVKGWEDANRQHIRFIENLNAPSPKESE